jgi:NTE family protein
MDSKTALVLSAGGMFGAWQAGVWDALHDVFNPDIVVGASVGALNAWQIACARSGAELTSKWIQAGDLAHVRWRIPRSWTQGMLDGSALESWIRTSCAGAPCRRFGVVVTRTRTMQPALFEWPDANWLHIAASCGVPFILPQQVIERQLYCDGGIVDPLPLGAAIAMGATRIVTVNVLRHRPWVVQRAVRAIHIATGYRLPDAAGIRVLDISPGGRLGTARDSMYWSAGNTRRWIDEGRAAAMGQRDAIMNLTGEGGGRHTCLSNPSAA